MNLSLTSHRVPGLHRHLVSLPSSPSPTNTLRLHNKLYRLGQVFHDRNQHLYINNDQVRPDHLLLLSHHLTGFNTFFISKLTTRENSVSLPVVSSGVATRNSSDFNTKISVIVELDLVILIGHCSVRNGGLLVKYLVYIAIVPCSPARAPSSRLGSSSPSHWGDWECSWSFSPSLSSSPR